MNRNIAVLVLSVFVAGSSAEGIAQPVDFQSIGAELTTTMLKCPERIWPNYNWWAINVSKLLKLGGRFSQAYLQRTRLVDVTHGHARHDVAGIQCSSGCCEAPIEIKTIEQH